MLKTTVVMILLLGSVSPAWSQAGTALVHQSVHAQLGQGPTQERHRHSRHTPPLVLTGQITDDHGVIKSRVIHHFDLLYREIKKETADPSGNIFVDTQYDGNGRKWKVSNPYRTGDTVVWTTTAYDPLDRPVTVTAPDSSVVGYTYTDNQTTVTDEAGNQRRYTYDGLGRMTKVEEPNPTLSTPLVTTYAYNVLGKLTQTVQGSQTRTFNFDALGRMTSQVLPESGTTSFTYNADDLLLTKTDARNITSTITYDSTQVHQPYSHTYSDSTPAVTFGYNSRGLKTSMTDAVGSVAYTYDSNNDRLTQESRTLTGVTGAFTTGYGYNKKGDLTSMTYPSGRVVNFNYVTGSGCCNSRLDSVVDQTTSTTLNYNLTYNPAGEVTAHTLGNGISQTYSYNNRLEQTAITASLSGTSVMNFAYDYGTSTTNTGRVLARTDSIQQEHSAKYIYDSIYRLGQSISNDSSWGVAWTFDTWGNRVTQTPEGLATSKVGTQTLGYTNNRLTGNTYDAAGNQTNDGTHNYTFSAENQILSMDGGAATYAYDGEGRRMKKVTSTETTYTFYGPGGIISEFTTSNAIATATTASSTDKCFYHTSDKLGSAVLVMNASGLVIENNRTLPYGEAWMAESTPSTNDKKFTTFQRDVESGLDYAINRFYGNTSGRFNSPDTGKFNLTVPSTLNRYNYAIGDPVNFKDANGKAVILLRNGGCDFFGGVSLGPTVWDEEVYEACAVPAPTGIDDGSGNAIGIGGEALQAPAAPILRTIDLIGKYGAFTDEQMNRLANARALIGGRIDSSDFAGCSDLLGGVDNARRLLATQTFSYALYAVNNNFRPANIPDAAWQEVQDIAYMPNKSVGYTYGNDTFFNQMLFNMTDRQIALVMFHELMHGAGHSQDIDNDYQANYAEIASKCDLDNHLK